MPSSPNNVPGNDRQRVSGHPGEGDYREVFAAIDIGFGLVELIFDRDRVVDCRFLETNAQFLRQTGLRDPVGQTWHALQPALDGDWIGTFGEIARTGHATRFETRVAQGDRRYDAQVARIGEPGSVRIAVLLSDVTERHRTETLAREAEERLQLALSAGGGIGTWDWDIARDRVTADARFALLYGVDPAAAAAGAPITTFFQGIHPDDRARTEQAIEMAVQSGGPFEAEYRLLERDGTIRWVIAQGRCERAADGTALRFPGISFEITARKLADVRQTALLALGDAIRDLTDPAAIAYAAAEILGHALQVSRVGYGVIDTLAETITVERDWNAPETRTLAGMLQFRDYGSYIEDLKAGRTVVIADVERDPRTAAGAAGLKAISAWSFVNMPLLEQDAFVALLYANHDQPRVWAEEELQLMREVADRVRAATERLRAEAALRESEEQFRVFAQAVPSLIWAARPDGEIYWVNQQVYDYAGISLGALTGSGTWLSLVHADDREATATMWQAARDTGTTYAAEFRLRSADGGYRWFLARAEPVRTIGGQITRWVGTNTDIDDGRRHAAELLAWTETLEDQVAARTRELMDVEAALRQSQKMEAVGQLTGGLAHDFNNLLTGIMGSLELLGIRIAQGRLGDVERYSLAAQGAAKRAAALTHRLLAFSRRQTLDPRPTDVNRLIGGLEELVRRTVGPDIAVEVVASAGLWSTLVDPNQLENAILNLCINARDAMPTGGRLTIETANRWIDARMGRDRDLDPGQYVSLCVSDNGTGMPPEVVAKAFDPFFTTKPLGLGTGLGLSMIYGFARQSGGQVRIYSEVGEGSNICIYLPRHFGPSDEDEPQPDFAEAPRAIRGETVLIVDDEPTVRMLVVEVLEELGYAAIEAADGPAGLKVLQSDTRIDLLVTDVGLPGGMNGRQMADAARVGRPDLKILFITGYAENAVVGNGHLDPGMHVMTKPFAIDALAGRIRDLIRLP
ncbi:PAS domain-containing protein [Sphingomonas aerolata]|uniref:PAS domain-containing protein n=1 Tax=Sphingomonas aerolata TaxID=185951 RepID=UPI002FE40453